MIKIYHNPRCQKSREALAILEASGNQFEVIKYLEETPTKKALEEILTLLNIPVIDLVRKNETTWKENFKNKKLSDDEILNALIKHPKLIERPIVINQDKAIIARPPEVINSIIRLFIFCIILF